MAQINGGSAGALLLLDEDDCSVLHAIDAPVAAVGLASGVAVDVTTLPNSDVIIIHQDASSGNHWTFSADRLTVRVTGAGLSGKPANWFADGWIQTGAGTTFQYATILESAVVTDTIHELKLNWPLHSAALADAAKVVAGCDGKFGTCGTKFSNQVNFGGHPRVPIDNPALPTIPVESGGGKK